MLGYHKQHNSFLCRYDCKGKNTFYPDGIFIKFNQGERGVTIIKRNRGVTNSNSSLAGKSFIKLGSLKGQDFFKSGLSGLLKVHEDGYKKV